MDYRTIVRQATRKRIAWSVNAASTSVDDAYEYAREEFENNKMDIDELIPDFRRNYKLLQSKLKHALDIPRKQMPVIEPDDIDLFNKRLSDGKIDIFKPFAKGHLWTPEQLSKDEAEEWVELGIADGNSSDDVVKGKKTGIAVGDLLPTQSQIWFDKVIENMTNYGIPDSGSPVLSKTVIVSDDGYILDGHHRFAQAIVADPSLRMSALQVPLRIDALLSIGKSYSEAIGNQPKASLSAGLEESISDRVAKYFVERQGSLVQR